MRLNLHKLIKPELELLKENCNFTEDESTIFYLLSKGKSRTEIAIALSMSIQGVDKHIAAIKKKIMRFDEMECEYYNVVDIASILGISRTSAYKMFALEDFPCVKIGNRSLIKKDKFDAYMEEHLKSTIYITP